MADGSVLYLEQLRRFFAGLKGIFATKADVATSSTMFGVCSTLPSRAAKTVTIAGFDELIPGVTIRVRFLFNNTADSPTLDVSGTGAKPIKCNSGSTSATDISWTVQTVLSFTYDDQAEIGGCWFLNGIVGNAGANKKGLMSAEDKAKLDGIEAGAKVITVDSAIDSSSTNPVKNVAISAALDGKMDVLPDWDISENNTDFVISDTTSAGVYNEYVFERNSAVSRMSVYEDHALAGRIQFVDGGIELPNGNLTVSGTNVQRIIRLDNGVRNCRLTANTNGTWGIYDEKNSAWILYSDSNQNVSIPHSLLLEGHGSAVGTIIESETVSSKALNASSWTTLVSLSLPAGKWSVSGYATIVNQREKMLTITLQGGNTSYARNSVYASGSNSCTACVTDYISPTSTIAINLQGWCASAFTPLNCKIRAIRIA